jgi:hypothetical protein
MPLLGYKKHNLIYRLLRKLIDLTPLPSIVAVKTKYGVLIVPKSFRVLTFMLDLVEPEVKRTFEKWVREADIFIDVGAGYDGWYTLKALRLNEGVRVIAFEPDKAAYHVLMANLAINDLLDRATALNIACSDHNSNSARRLDDVLDELEVKLSRRSLIKIDVEGAAYKVLKGMENTLTTAYPRLIIEQHPGEESVPSYLTKLGYRVEQVSNYFIIAYKP